MPYRPHKFRALSKPKHIHKSQHRHYWPYIPALLIILATVFVSVAKPMQKRGVLAYATNTSISGLLAATNQQRSQNGAGNLSLNSQLTSAAQAKANDMIARNYWSHNTPDGQEPWVFIDSAGYKYLKAGENLAYGFGTSDDTVTGWMNSPPHRENLLDSDFSDVGFGFANGQDYNNSGPETVVVAMYGKPQVLAASNQQSAPPAPQSAPAPTATPQPTAPLPETSPVPAAAPQAAQPTETTKPTTKPVTTDAPIVAEPVTQHVARIQTLTRGKAPWAYVGIGILTGLAMTLLLAKHAAALRHLLRGSERFILHHPLLDTILVSVVFLGTILSQTTGFIR